MDNAAANQLIMFSAEALITAFLLLGLFRMRSRLGLFPLYVTLGVFQPIQVMLRIYKLFQEISATYIFNFLCEIGLFYRIQVSFVND